MYRGGFLFYVSGYNGDYKSKPSVSSPGLAR